MRWLSLCREGFRTIYLDESGNRFTEFCGELHRVRTGMKKGMTYRIVPDDIGGVRFVYRILQTPLTFVPRGVADILPWVSEAETREANYVHIKPFYAPLVGQRLYELMLYRPMKPDERVGYLKTADVEPPPRLPRPYPYTLAKVRADNIRQVVLSHSLGNRVNLFIADLPEGKDLFGQSYIWDPEARVAQKIEFKDVGPVVWEGITFHTFGYVMLFKPSAGEVLVQLPDDLFRDRSKRWLITTECWTNHAPSSAIAEMYHVAITKVYKDKWWRRRSKRLRTQPPPLENVGE